MPGNKRWFLETIEGGHGILLYREGKEAYYKAKEGNLLLVPVKEALNGAEISQARTFKAYAIEVTNVTCNRSYLLTVSKMLNG